MYSMAPWQKHSRLYSSSYSYGWQSPTSKGMNGSVQPRLNLTGGGSIMIQAVLGRPLPRPLTAMAGSAMTIGTILPLKAGQSPGTTSDCGIEAGIKKCYSFPVQVFPCSSAVEQSPVKRLVVGSNPTGGAK
jgi:hypothetical protein